MRILTSRPLLLAVAFAIAALAFWRQIELGVPSTIAYATAVAFAYAARSSKWVWIVAAICSLLALLGAMIDQPTAWHDLLARSLFAIWAPAYPCAKALTERAERECLAGIVNWSGDAIISQTLDGIVTHWNRGAESLYGYMSEEMIGKPYSAVVPSNHGDECSGLKQKLRAGETVIQCETTRICKDGSRLDVALTASPIIDSIGKMTGIATIGRDITDKKRIDAERQRMAEELERRVEERSADLRRAKEALERSNRDLQQFAYVASHDLQTPLRAIAGFAQFLQIDYGGRLDAQAEDYIRRIIRGATRLQELIQDLLEFSRVESRECSIGPVDMNEVFERSLDALHAAIQESGAQVTKDPLPMVTGNPFHLGSLLENLIDNAIKYRTEAAPRIHVSYVQEDDVWRFRVKDNGIGIAPEYGDRIFEVFQRLHAASDYPGTGIGLSLCRRIVTRYGGKIWVEGDVGRGSSFLFTLPKPAELDGAHAGATANETSSATDRGDQE
ncbi:MAG: ATP-binding protein [Bryobacterales bacterium]